MPMIYLRNFLLHLKPEENSKALLRFLQFINHKFQVYLCLYDEINQNSTLHQVHSIFWLWRVVYQWNVLFCYILVLLHSVCDGFNDPQEWLLSFPGMSTRIQTLTIDEWRGMPKKPGKRLLIYTRVCRFQCKISTLGYCLE